MGSKCVVLIRGNLNIPELGPGDVRRRLGAAGMRCRELGISLERTDKQLKRTNPISDSVGKFVISVDESGQKITTGDFHIPCLEISRLRGTPWVLPARLGGIHPLSHREAIKAI